MSKPAGYNPMRWDCKAQGQCYNKTLRPRIEEFAGCFPRKIGMSDVDGVVELGGRFLFLEWKAAGGVVQFGQKLMFERLTSLSPDPMKINVIVVCGHPRTLDIQSVQVFTAGKGGAVEACDLDGLKSRISAWAKRAESCKTRPSRRASA